MTATGFAHFRNGKVHGFDQTKRGLLVGYDMMPLLGLRRMERRLLKWGTIERVRLVVDDESRSWGATKDGIPSIEFMSWGGPYDSKASALSSLAGFIVSRHENHPKRRALYRLWTPTMHPRRAPRQLKEALDAIRQLGWDVARMRFVPGPRIGAER